jgi:antitoxin YefM
MIAADELQSLLETAHPLRSPTTPSDSSPHWPAGSASLLSSRACSNNAERLLAALARARSQDLAPMTVKALEERVGLEG